MTISEIHNYASLAEFTRKAHRCVLKASASWCRPCKAIAPFYASLSVNYPALWFGEFDVDEAADVAKFYKTESMPTFYFIEQGRVVQTVSGANRQDLLRAVSNFVRKM